MHKREENTGELLSPRLERQANRGSPKLQRSRDSQAETASGASSRTSKLHNSQIARDLVGTTLRVKNSRGTQFGGGGLSQYCETYLPQQILEKYSFGFLGGVG